MDVQAITTIVLALEEKRKMLTDALNMANQSTLSQLTRSEMKEDRRAVDYALQEVDRMIESMKGGKSAPVVDQKEFVLFEIERKKAEALVEIAHELNQIKAALYATVETGEERPLSEIVRGIGQVMAG